MLVVVSIILLVAVVALPGISSLSKSSSRRNAVSLVLGALDGARAQAVAKSGNCFIVFADDNLLLPENYRCRSFAIFEEVFIPVPAGDSVSVPYHLLLVRPWTLLPEGVAFRPDGKPGDDGSVPGGKTVFNAPRRNFYCKPANQDLNLPYIQFNSMGAVELGNTTPITADEARLRIFEGFIGPNGVPQTTNAAKTLADETITVSLFTGRAKREEIKKETNAPS